MQETQMAFAKLEDPLVNADVLADLQKYVKSGHISVDSTGSVVFESGNDAANTDDGDDDAAYESFKQLYIQTSLDAEDIA